VELIVAVMALTQGEVVIVQTSLIGSILSNLLLVLGMCFFFGGLRRLEQFFNTTVAQTAASLLALAVAGVNRGIVGPAGLMAAAGVAGPEQNEKMSRLLMNRPGEDEAEDPQLHFFVALGLLTGSTVIIALCAEFLVDSIDYVTTQGHISKEFLGLILLPIVGNAAEHATSVTVAIKDKMDLAIGVAVGSSMQVALFLIPLLVVIGWGMGNDTMNLSFDMFQVAVLFVAVLLVNYLIADGKSHWLEGMLLMCLYCIIAVCSWWYPVPDSSGSGNT